MGTPEAMRESEKDNCINLISAELLALMGLADILPVAKETFPAEKKMVAHVGQRGRSAC